MYGDYKGNKCNCNDCNSCEKCSCKEKKCCKEETCGCKIELSANCVRYEGKDLSCLDITKGERLESVIEKLDELYCNFSNEACIDGEDGAAGPVGPSGNDGVGVQSITTDPLDPCNIVFTLTDSSVFTYTIPGCGSTSTDTIEYTYTAFASDLTGTNFSLDPSTADTRCYMAIITSLTPLTPVVGDFAGQWFQYKYIPKEYVDSKSLEYGVNHPGGSLTDTSLDILPNNITIPAEYINNTDCVAEVNFHFKYEINTFSNGEQFNGYYTINGSTLIRYENLQDLVLVNDSGELHIKATIFRNDSSTISVRLTIWVESDNDNDGEVRIKAIEQFTVTSTTDIDIMFGVENTAGAAQTIQRDTTTYGYTVRSINPQIGC